MTTALDEEWGVSVSSRPLFNPGKDPVPIVQDSGWVSGPVWTGAENLASTGIRSPDLTVSSQSLYRLNYPAHSVGTVLILIIQFSAITNPTLPYDDKNLILLGVIKVWIYRSFRLSFQNIWWTLLIRNFHLILYSLSAIWRSITYRF
jgi:hypothetical protein